MPANYLLDLRVHDPDVPGFIYLRVSTKGFVTAPSDAPSHTIYPPHLRRPASMLYTVQDGVMVGNGQIEITNPNRELDHWVNYSYDGHPARMWKLEDGDAYLDAKLVLAAVMEQPEFDGETIRIVLRGISGGLDKHVQPLLYAGTGALEGTANLKGKPKPFLLQTGNNIFPVLVDPTKNIYQVSVQTPRAAGIITDDIWTGTTPDVYDQGVSWGTKGADYPDVATMNSTAPAAGTWRLLPPGNSGNTGTFFRLSGNPNGDLTADIILANYNIDGYWGHILEAMPAIAGVDNLSYLDDADAYNLIGSCRASLFYTEPTSVFQVFRDLLATIRGWLVFRLPQRAALNTLWHTSEATWTSQRYSVRYFADPADLPTSIPANAEDYAAATFVIDGAQIQRDPPVRRVALPDGDRGLPSWRVTLEYGRNFTVQDDADLAGAVTQARREYLREAYRATGDEDSAVLTAYPLANDDRIRTSLEDLAANVDTEATRQLDVFKVRRDILALRSAVDVDIACRVVPGDVATIQNWERFDCETSRDWIVLSIEVDFATAMADLVIWG